MIKVEYSREPAAEQGAGWTAIAVDHAKGLLL